MVEVVFQEVIFRQVCDIAGLDAWEKRDVRPRVGRNWKDVDHSERTIYESEEREDVGKIFEVSSREIDQSEDTGQLFNSIESFCTCREKELESRSYVKTFYDRKSCTFILVG